MLPTKIQVSQVVWTGRVNYRHLALLMENQKFLSMVTERLLAQGCTVHKYKGVSAVTETIEDLVVALEIDATKDGLCAQHVVHVKMEGFEVSFH